MHPPSSNTDEKESSTFHLQSTSQAFSSRSDDVFASLGQLEAKHTATLKARRSSQSSDDEGLMKDDSDDEDDESLGKIETESKAEKRQPRSWPQDSNSSNRNRERSRSSIKEYDPKGQSRPQFSRPTHRPPRNRKQYVPDFKLHPERWTHHSLNDVSDEDMSERSNTKAALDFLQERRQEREKQERIAAGLPAEEPKFDVSDGACSQGKISFSKPNSSAKNSSASIKKLEAPAKTTKGASTNDNDLQYADVDEVVYDSNNLTRTVDESRNSMPDKTGETGKETFKMIKKKKVSRQIRKKDVSEEDSDD